MYSLSSQLKGEKDTLIKSNDNSFQVLVLTMYQALSYILHVSFYSVLVTDLWDSYYYSHYMVENPRLGEV